MIGDGKDLLDEGQGQSMLDLGLYERCKKSNHRRKESGLFSRWDVLESAQGPKVEIEGRQLLMLASNNYHNFLSRPEPRQAAIEAIKKYGCGMAAGRTLCGTNILHEQLERRLAELSGTEAALLYHSCYSANIGTISTLAGEGDIIFSDQLNHASIIDGCRMSKADLKVYPHNDMATLERMLEEESDCKGLKMIVTDGVFSFDGDMVPLDELVKIARRHSSFIVCDEAHAAGVVGKTGRGTPEYFDVIGQVDVITGTLGKALGGTVGGYVAASREVIDYLINNARIFIFTNALPPAVVSANIASIDLLKTDPSFIKRLQSNAQFFRESLKGFGFEILGEDTGVIPILIRDTEKTMEMGRKLFDEGVFAPGFGYPVTPKGQARVRVQVSSEHTMEDMEFALSRFEKVGKQLGII